MQELFLPTGLQPDPIDGRDLLYSDVMTASVDPVDWEEGFSVYEELGIPPIVQDQGSSSSCVGQASAQHMRAWFRKITREDVDFSRRFIYAHISIGRNFGAYLRDGARFLATYGNVPESVVRSYEDGRPPTEDFMLSRAGIGAGEWSLAEEADRFSYRAIPGSTDDIEAFAHAIRNNCGVIGGFAGDNAGWTRAVAQPPKGASQWAHCVFLAGFGMYQGQKCVFTPNSWGGRYTIQEGRWKGYQAIPEAYFKALLDTAVGPVAGAHVLNSWVLVPDGALTPNQKVMDFLKKNEGKLVQDVQGTGAFGLVKGGKILVAAKTRLIELCLTYLMRKEGVAVPKDLWNDAPKSEF